GWRIQPEHHGALNRNRVADSSGIKWRNQRNRQVTNIHYLNDISEFVYSLNLLMKNLQEKNEQSETETKIFRRALASSYQNTNIEQGDKFSNLMIMLKTYDRVPIYISSFSQNGDQLGQWRGYCNNESGFSIGFDYVKLKELAENQKFTLTKCEYEPSEHSVIIEEHANNLIKSIDFDDPGNYENYIKALTSFWATAPKIKHNSFKEEAEWRLISQAIGVKDMTPRFRPGNSTIIPYNHFSMEPELPIREIIVGPNPNVDLAIHSTRIVMLAHNLRQIKITESKIPYRTW
ncbi:Protein of unknown function, partial [Syntrophus gentianae]